MRRAAFAGLWAVGLLARALELRHSDSFDGDGAVYLLMAKHIAELKEFPLYMWLNHYGGTLSEYLAAACFRGFGVSLWAGRLPGLVWSCALAALCYELARRLFGSRAAAVALALALNPP